MRFIFSDTNLIFNFSLIQFWHLIEFFFILQNLAKQLCSLWQVRIEVEESFKFADVVQRPASLKQFMLVPAFLRVWFKTEKKTVTCRRVYFEDHNKLASSRTLFVTQAHMPFILNSRTSTFFSFCALLLCRSTAGNQCSLLHCFRFKHKLRSKETNSALHACVPIEPLSFMFDGFYQTNDLILR